MTDMPQTDTEWREKLTPQQYKVLRQAGTELPFSGEYVNEKRDGVYRCAGCGEKLFSSDTKYNSFSGWPSFFKALDPDMIDEVDDRSHGMVRTEVRCSNCGGHLGHLFDDGPDPTGMRYCINSAALDLDTHETGESEANQG